MVIVMVYSSRVDMNVYDIGRYDIWLVVSNMAFIFHNIWDVILPIDSYFSRCLLHHQPEKYDLQK